MRVRIEVWVAEGRCGGMQRMGSEGVWVGDRG